MADVAAPATPPAAAPPAAPATAWHQGVEADTIGAWQTKGLDYSDPTKLAVELTKHWKAAERYIGVPADKLLRIPNPDDSTAWAGVWEKLGAPKEAKDYEIPSKYADGKDIETGLVDAMRSTFAKTHVPKEAAAEIAKAIVKFVDDTDSAESFAAEQRTNEQMARLTREWGPHKDANLLKAVEGARRAGVTPEQVKDLENVLGKDTVAKLFYRIGLSTSEAPLIEGSTNNGNPTTREAAISQRRDLMSDPDWVRKYNAGGRKELEQIHQLNQLIAGVNEAEELAALGVR